VYLNIVLVCNIVCLVCRIIWSRFVFLVCFAFIVEFDLHIPMPILCWSRSRFLVVVQKGFKICSPGTVLARRRIRTVGNLRVVISRASVGQWLNWDNIVRVQ
jgi:hypothetical protein